MKKLILTIGLVISLISCEKKQSIDNIYIVDRDQLVCYKKLKNVESPLDLAKAINEVKVKHDPVALVIIAIDGDKYFIQTVQNKKPKLYKIE